ncbi:sensor histidine kinase regulating citrate/malate metabolism [Lipingzhangella halophila]|uniref:histidine kinase n=1 Tax=Lipingzhangella halophila TaxID=1783352 RepID=A0A7W7W475_9ACTN|nr:sensor histidine kinase [Lipingzhangella halophila]MBB4933822.1 sensor histidine kinase regulating citrate/malate metabolism [Lipingzhangella halophila]
MRPRITLAGQFLALQLAIVVAVLLAVVGVSVAQADARFRQVEGQAMLAVAESAASMDAVRAGLAAPEQQGILQPTAESLRSLSEAEHLIITGTDRRMLSSTDPREIGREMDFGESSVLSGSTWIGVVRIGEERVLAAHVPVIDDEGVIIGVAVAGRSYPGPVEQLATAAPTLLVYVGIASVLGVAGSLLLARRIKWQTLGLEPGEITRLAEDRTAMLHGIKEGVLGLDRANRVTLVNDKAAELLDLPGDAVGRTLDELGVDTEIRRVLTDEEQEPDRVVLMGERLVTLNSMPLNRGNRRVGSVTTMRDRTDLAQLQQELDFTRTTTEALRAQAHEFSNQIHVITGLLELEEHDEAARYVSTIGGARTQLSDDVTSRVADSSVAALLIAKASLAAEQDVTLRVSAGTGLDAQDPDLSADLVTVVGNLVDNALDAVRGGPDPWVEVDLAEDNDAVRVRVSDSGRGVPPELAWKVFLRGFSTKGAESVYRGVGLALVRLVCSRRGGSVEVDGAEFTALLPTGVPRRPPP